MSPARRVGPRPVAGDRADLAGWPRLIEEFCEQMAVRGYSERTINNRRATVILLAEWCAQRGIARPVEVSRAVLETYQRSLFHHRKTDGQPLSFRSQNERLGGVRAFFKWAARARHLLVNPASELELPKVEHRLPAPPLTATEAELVLAQPDLNSPLGVRDRAMLEVLYSTGIRRAELRNLAVTDLDPERATLLVRQGKGRRDRLVPIGARALVWCRRYLVEVRPRLVVDPDGGTLFLNYEGAPLHLDRLTMMARHYVEASGVGKTGACHLFRHTMATLMLEGGADIRYIQAMLGHAELATTALYTQVSLRALQAVHTATHPGSTNTSHHHHGGDGDVSGSSRPGPAPVEGRKVAATELLAALDQEDQEENRPDPGSAEVDRRPR